MPGALFVGLVHQGDALGQMALAHIDQPHHEGGGSVLGQVMQQLLEAVLGLVQLLFPVARHARFQQAGHG